jgi:hypothetical protein
MVKSMAEIDYFGIVRIFSNCNVKVTLNLNLQGGFGTLNPITVKHGSHVNVLGAAVELTPNDVNGFDETGFPLENNETDLFLSRGIVFNNIACVP